MWGFHSNPSSEEAERATLEVDQPGYEALRSFALLRTADKERRVTKKPGKRPGKLLQLGELPGLCAIPIVDVVLHLILSEAIALLDLAFQLITATVDDGEVIVG